MNKKIKRKIIKWFKKVVLLNQDPTTMLLVYLIASYILIQLSYLYVTKNYPFSSGEVPKVVSSPQMVEEGLKEAKLVYKEKSEGIIERDLLTSLGGWKPMLMLYFLYLLLWALYGISLSEMTPIELPPLEPGTKVTDIFSNGFFLQARSRMPADHSCTTLIDLPTSFISAAHAREVRYTLAAMEKVPEDIQTLLYFIARLEESRRSFFRYYVSYNLNIVLRHAAQGLRYELGLVK